MSELIDALYETPSGADDVSFETIKSELSQLLNEAFSEINEVDSSLKEVEVFQEFEHLEEKHSDIFKEFLVKETKESLEDLSDTNLLKMYTEYSEAKQKFEDAESDLDRDLYTSRQYYGFPIYSGPNCYAFACNMIKTTEGEKFDSNPHPGEISGHIWNADDYEVLKHGSLDEIKNLLTTGWRLDCNAMGKELVEVNSADYKLQPGERLVSMSYTRSHPDDPSGGPDFHFMAKEESGFFLHKPGVTAVTYRDDNGNYITDPANCATKYESHLGYFVIRDKK